MVGYGNHIAAMLAQALHQFLALQPGLWQAQNPSPELIRLVAVEVVAMQVDTEPVFRCKASLLFLQEAVEAARE